MITKERKVNLMKRIVYIAVLLALSALLCGCHEPNEAAAGSSAVTESSVSEPADCCGGEIPDCCKEKEGSKSDCCKEDESGADCCQEQEEADCCKEESKPDCCKEHES